MTEPWTNRTGPESNMIGPWTNMTGPWSRLVDVSGLSRLTLAKGKKFLLGFSFLKKVSVVLEDLDKSKVAYNSNLFVM